jgi:membrane associated rhomboid family serine protease
MFAPVRDGEVWRLVTGPFFHSGPAHFLVNFSSLLLIGPIAWAIFGPRTVAIFFAGNVVGALAQMAWGSRAFDSYAGVSSGFLALYGFVCVAGALDRELLPRGFAVLCACIAVITVIGGELLTPNAASLGHLGGVLAGVVCGLAIRWRRIRRQLAAVN